MKFYGLKSIISSSKAENRLPQNTSSFFVQTDEIVPFIEPEFIKEDFAIERPNIVLISAVGCSGKTTVAHVLSHATQLPVLDLALHKPVGDNTLTGLLTSAYLLDDIGVILSGFQKGTHGVIIDGLDEGRSKTTEQAFEAFLDDLVTRASGSPNTVIVIFGRSQVLIDAWCYLAEKIKVGLLQMLPFDLVQAKEYIDAKSKLFGIDNISGYSETRDIIIDSISGALGIKNDTTQNKFLSFMGYPPVLDAISRLLKEEQNFFKVRNIFLDKDHEHYETRLLVEICDLLLTREKEEKAFPNFISKILEESNNSGNEEIRSTIFSHGEQCARLLAFCLGKSYEADIFSEDELNFKYEEAANAWIVNHPFLSERKIDNPVFSAYALSQCMLSSDKKTSNLAIEYSKANPSTYHLLYIMDIISGHDSVIDARCFNALVQASSDFTGVGNSIDVEISAEQWEDGETLYSDNIELIITVDFSHNDGDEIEKRFCFSGKINSSYINIGPSLINMSITVPCDVVVTGDTSIFAYGKSSINCKDIFINAQDLVLQFNKIGKESKPASLEISAQNISANISAYMLRGGSISLDYINNAPPHPLSQFSTRIAPNNLGENKEKYKKIRRIFSEFRAHKKGKMARLADKINHERIMRGAGRPVLKALLNAKIIYQDGIKYFLNQDMLATTLGTTWTELRQYQMSTKLKSFLDSIPS